MVEVGLTQEIGKVLGSEHSDYRAIQTIQMMRFVAKEGTEEPRLQRITSDLISSCKDDTCRISNILRYIEKHLRFRHDPDVLYKGKRVKSEVLYRHKELLDQIEKNDYAYGDCDDYSTFTAAMFLLSGMKARFYAVETGEHPGELDHIFAGVYNRDVRQWQNADKATKRQDWTGHRFMLSELKPMNKVFVSKSFGAFPWEGLIKTTGGVLSDIFGKYKGPQPPYGYQQPIPPQISGGGQFAVDTTTLFIGGLIVVGLIAALSSGRRR